MSNALVGILDREWRARLTALAWDVGEWKHPFSGTRRYWGILKEEKEQTSSLKESGRD